MQQHDPEFAPYAIYYLDGVYVADDFETRRVTVDPSTGEILGDFNTSGDDGFVRWTMSLMFNLHVCGLTCEGYVGYQAWLVEPVPGTGWLGFDGEPVSWGLLILGLTAVLLLFLSLSGIWLWWPGIKRWFVGVRVRWKKGRYARDYDLHQVAGMIAIPLLLLWAVTGMSYEFGFVERAWYGLTPGEPPAEGRVLESTESDEPDIGVAAAVAAAMKHHNDTPISVDIPAEDDPAATYGIWFQDGIDPYGKAVYPGDFLVSVDRKTGETMTTYGEYGSKAEELWSDWNFPLHAGWALNSWVRIIWVVLGLVPLLLAVPASRPGSSSAGCGSAGAACRGRVTATTLQVVVAYLALVGVLAVLRRPGVRCGTAVQTGVLVGGMLLVAQAVLDLSRTSRAPSFRPRDAPRLPRRLGRPPPAAGGARARGSRGVALRLRRRRPRVRRSRSRRPPPGRHLELSP